MKVDIQHDAGRQRFECVVDGHPCVCVYEMDGAVMRIVYTGVPTAVGGRGIAAELVRTALDWARQRQSRVDPACSYVAAYMRRHPETLDLLAG